VFVGVAPRSSHWRARSMSTVIVAGYDRGL